RSVRPKYLRPTKDSDVFVLVVGLSRDILFGTLNVFCVNFTKHHNTSFLGDKYNDPLAGFEPATMRLENSCSIQLSYRGRRGSLKTYQSLSSSASARVGVTSYRITCFTHSSCLIRMTVKVEI